MIKKPKTYKILIFSTAYLPLIGGAEIAVKEITDRLPDCEFDLICAKIKKNLASREKIGAIEVWRLGKGLGKLDKFFLPWRGVKLASWLYQQKKYDAVWAVMASFGGLAALFFKKKFPEIPYLLTLQEGDPPEHIRSRARWLGPYYRQIFQKADLITTISQYLKDYALKNGASCQIEVVPNGVNLEKFDRDVILSPKGEESCANARANKWRDPSVPVSWRVPQDDIKEVIRIKNGEKIIITVSRLVEKNGIGDAIEAMRYLPENVKFLILGEGPLEKSLKLKVKNLKLEDRVLFLGDVPNEKVPKYLAISDVFVRPSISEGLGTAFLEAMAAGLPIIGTPVGGIPDFLVDKETGLFCEVRNPKSIAEKINLLLSDENLRQKLIIKSRKLIEEKYNWDLIARKMENIFNKLQVKT